MYNITHTLTQRSNKMNTFTIAGTSVKNGTTKVRWANGSAENRAKMLDKDGQTDVVLVELPLAMSKLHATKFINTLPEFGSVEQQTAIAEYLASHDDGSELVVVYEQEEVQADTDTVEESNDEPAKHTVADVVDDMEEVDELDEDVLAICMNNEYDEA